MRVLAASSVAAALLTLAGPLRAQQVTPECRPGANGNTTYSEDACQKASDLFQYIAPQLGVALAGGNAVLGQGGTLGGLGHVYISVRANVLSGSVPRIEAVTPSVEGARSDQYPTRSQIVALPIADVVIGLFGGIPLGVTRVGGLDALVNATYLPAITSGAVTLREPRGQFKFGGGARLGIVQEGLLFPGLSVTAVRRQLPTLDVTARAGNDTLKVSDGNVIADSYRLVANKTFLIFALAAGVGQDRYKSSASVSAYVAPRALAGGQLLTPEQRPGPVPFSQTVTRTTYFVDGTLSLLPFVKLIGEVGRASGGRVTTFNTFQGNPPNAARLYGSLGLRLGF